MTFLTSKRFHGVLLAAGLCLASSGIATAAEREEAPGITLPRGTHIPIRLAQSLDTKRDKPGTPFVAHVAAAVVHDGHVIIPRGTPCRGHIVEAKPSGRLKGRAVMRLSLDSFQLNGATYRVETTDPAFFSKSHKKRNAALIGGGAGTGATIGAIAGGGIGALVGAGAGAAVGTTGALITGKRNIYLRPETRLTFALREPVRVRG